MRSRARFNQRKPIRTPASLSPFNKIATDRKNSLRCYLRVATLENQKRAPFLTLSTGEGGVTCRGRADGPLVHGHVRETVKRPDEE